MRFDSEWTQRLRVDEADEDRRTSVNSDVFWSTPDEKTDSPSYALY